MSRQSQLLQQPKHENTVALMLQDGFSPEQVIKVHTEAGRKLSEVVRLVLLAGTEPKDFNNGYLTSMTGNRFPDVFFFTPEMRPVIWWDYEWIGKHDTNYQSDEEYQYSFQEVVTGVAYEDWRKENPRYPDTWQSDGNPAYPRERFLEDGPLFDQLIRQVEALKPGGEDCLGVVHIVATVDGIEHDEMFYKSYLINFLTTCKLEDYPFNQSLAELFNRPGGNVVTITRMEMV